MIGYASTRLQNRKDQWTEAQIEEDDTLKAMREELGEEASGPAAGDDDDDDDDDVVTMQVEESFVCPITTKTLEEPVRSAKCKHYYEKKAIFAILKKVRSVKSMEAALHGDLFHSLLNTGFPPSPFCRIMFRDGRSGSGYLQN